MTYKEAAKVLDRIQDEENWSCKAYDALQLAIETIHTADKYSWHDLRKNPDDLPEKEGLYAVTVRYDTELTEIGFGCYENMYGYSSGWSALMPNYGSIIAWKEIEPFEGI